MDVWWHPAFLARQVAVPEPDGSRFVQIAYLTDDPYPQATMRRKAFKVSPVEGKPQHKTGTTTGSRRGPGPTISPTSAFMSTFRSYRRAPTMESRALWDAGRRCSRS